MSSAPSDQEQLLRRGSRLQPLSGDGRHPYPETPPCIACRPLRGVTYSLFLRHQPSLPNSLSKTLAVPLQQLGRLLPRMEPLVLSFQRWLPVLTEAALGDDDARQNRTA